MGGGGGGILILVKISSHYKIQKFPFVFRINLLGLFYCCLVSEMQKKLVSDECIIFLVWGDVSMVCI